MITYADMFDRLASLLFPLAVALPRLLAACNVAPLLSSKAVPMMARMTMVVCMAFFLYPLHSTLTTSLALSPIVWIVIILKEVFIGFCLGFVCSIFVWVVEGIGSLFDTLVGNNNVSLFNPMIGQDSGPFSIFLAQFGAVLFLALGGFLFLLKTLFASFVVWPVISYFPVLPDGARGKFINWGAEMLSTSMQLAMPIMAVLVLVDFGLGLLNRSVTQLNAYSLSMPIKAIVAVLFLALTIVFIGGSHGPLLSVLDLGRAFLHMRL